MPAMPDTTDHRYRIHFVIIFLLISFNLRMAFSAADPLLVFLMRDLGLSIGSSGLFGLLPVITLGAAALLGARLVEVIRPHMLIVYALSAAVCGVVWRSYGGITGLFGGMVIIGLGLGITGSVILGIVKQLFPGELPELMGGYTACVCLGTAVGSGASDPIALMLGGWRNGLLFWALPLILATLLWVELICRNRPPEVRRGTLRAGITPLLKQKKAWMVSLFYLFRVAGAWLLIVWLATLMRRRGLSLVEGGLVLAVATACEIPGALLSEFLIRLIGSKTRLMQIAIPMSVISCWGLLEAPLNLWPMFAGLFGISIGTIFSLGMILIVENSADEATTVALSGLAQGMGFIVGGLLAWGAGFAMNTHRPDVLIAALYSAFALCGLVFGCLSDRPGMVRVSPTPLRRE